MFVKTNLGFYSNLNKPLCSVGASLPYYGNIESVTLQSIPERNLPRAILRADNFTLSSKCSIESARSALRGKSVAALAYCRRI